VQPANIIIPPFPSDEMNRELKCDGGGASKRGRLRQESGKGSRRSRKTRVSLSSPPAAAGIALLRWALRLYRFADHAALGDSTPRGGPMRGKTLEKEILVNLGTNDRPLSHNTI
jgi:hypothetical protein